MDEQDYNLNNDRKTDSWDFDFYETGNTKPPKSHRGMLALMLITGILIGGFLSMLGGVDSEILAQWRREEEDVTLPVSLQMENSTGSQMEDSTEGTFSKKDNGAESDASVEINPSSQTAEPLTLQQIYRKNIPSVVSIICRLPNGNSSGTGVVLSENGYVITNSHVVQGATAVEVLFSDGKSLQANLVGTDTLSDLAVLYVEAGNLTPAQFGNSDDLQVGDTVVAIGDPLGVELRGTMTDGIVSAINRDLTTGGRTMTLIQTNAALNSGNSGGPLINSFGQVVGINTMKIGDYVSSAGVEGLGFAIPSTTVKDIVDQLISQGYVSGRPSLGITGIDVPKFYQYYYRLPAGIYVSDVEPGSNAEKQGIAVKDIILSVDGRRIVSQDDLKTVLYAHKMGDPVKVIYYRAGREYSVTLTLDESRS